jgi:hypothetical protein
MPLRASDVANDGIMDSGLSDAATDGIMDIGDGSGMELDDASLESAADAVLQCGLSLGFANNQQLWPNNALNEWS